MKTVVSDPKTSLTVTYLLLKHTFSPLIHKQSLNELKEKHIYLVHRWFFKKDPKPDCDTYTWYTVIYVFVNW